MIRNKSTRKKIFVRFLKENNCYKQFLNNTNDTLKHSLRYLDFKSFDELISLFSKEKIILHSNEISHCFSWSSTNEGYDFWKTMCNKWSCVVRNSY